MKGNDGVFVTCKGAVLGILFEGLNAKIFTCHDFHITSQDSSFGFIDCLFGI